MLARLPQGSEAITYQNTLFRISELCWIKAVRLPIPVLVLRVLALVLAIGWVIFMQKAKGTYYNVEFLLAVFPLMLAWSTAGSLKIGCSGDFEEAYESRRGIQTSLFRGWIEALRQKEPEWLHLKSSDYDLLLNPHRVAWIRPCFQWRLFPLVVAAIFYGYIKLVGLNYDFGDLPVISDFHILTFNNSGTIITMSYVVIVVSLLLFGFSIRRSVEICGTGGVQDVFPLTAEDQAAVLGILAGTTTSSATKPAAAKSKQIEVAKDAPSKPSPATKQPAAAPKPAPAAPQAAPAQAQTAPLAHSVTEELKKDSTPG